MPTVFETGGQFRPQFAGSLCYYDTFITMDAARQWADDDTLYGGAKLSIKEDGVWNLYISQDDGTLTKIDPNGGSSVIVVDSFPESDYVVNSLYLTNEGDLKFRTDSDWIDISLEVSTVINESSTDTTVPSSLAVKAYVDEATKNLDGQQHIFSNSTFPETGQVADSIYVNADGFAKLFDGQGYVNISTEVVEEINDQSTNDEVPTSLAVKTYVDSHASGDVQHIFKITEDAPTSIVNNSIYVNKDGKTSIADSTGALTDISIMVSTEVTSDASNTEVYSGLAIKTYVDNAVTNLVEIVTSTPSTDDGKLRAILES